MYQLELLAGWTVSKIYRAVMALLLYRVLHPESCECSTLLTELKAQLVAVRPPRAVSL